MDHIVPRSADGPTVESNLALACVGCLLRKAAKLKASDPVTGESVMLFNPRRETWSDHFHFEGHELVGNSPTGRATITALGMNRPMILAIREEQALLGRGPWSDDDKSGR